MKKSTVTEEQILYALRQVEAGTPPAEVCRQLGCSEASFYIWKERDGSLGLSEVKELRRLRDENSRLKRLVADLTLDKHILPKVVRSRRARPGQRGIGGAPGGIRRCGGCGSGISPPNGRASGISGFTWSFAVKDGS